MDQNGMIKKDLIKVLSSFFWTISTYIKYYQVISSYIIIYIYIYIFFLPSLPFCSGYSEFTMF